MRSDYIGGKVTVEIIDGTIIEAFFNTEDSEKLAQEYFGAAARFAFDIPDFRPPSDPIFDLNEDGAVNEADAETLVGLFDNPGDAPCDSSEGIPGDIDGDGQVGTMQDALAFREAFGSETGDPNFNPNADLDGNGRVNVGDLKIFRQIKLGLRKNLKKTITEAIKHIRY